MSSGDKLTYDRVERFVKAKIPQVIEDDILNAFAMFSIERDMTVDNLVDYFDYLELPHDLYKMVRSEDVVIEGTNIVDFDRILQCTYHLLIYMDNESVIDEFWGLLVRTSERDKSFPHVKLRDHVLSVKDLQRISNAINIGDSKGVIGMISCATNGKRMYMDYLDFAGVLGRLGLLRFKE